MKTDRLRQIIKEELQLSLKEKSSINETTGDEVWNVYSKLIEELGAEEVLKSIIYAMSGEESMSMAKHIADTFNISL